MTRTEFIQRMVAADQRDDGTIKRAVLIADALEASNVAPWGDTPASESAPDTSTATGGERACEIFFRIFGQRIYKWADLPVLERKAWEEVSATLTGRGAGAVDIVAREREACAIAVESLGQEVAPAQRQFLGYVATKIRARRTT